MKKAKERAEAKGKTELSYYLLHKFSQEYDRIMEVADKERPIPPDPPGKKRGRKKKGKERALIERLMLLKDAVCFFITRFYLAILIIVEFIPMERSYFIS